MLGEALNVDYYWICQENGQFENIEQKCKISAISSFTPQHLVSAVKITFVVNSYVLFLFSVNPPPQAPLLQQKFRELLMPV